MLVCIIRLLIVDENQFLLIFFLNGKQIESIMPYVDVNVLEETKIKTEILLRAVNIL